MRLNIQCNMNWLFMNNLVTICSEGYINFSSSSHSTFAYSESVQPEDLFYYYSVVLILICFLISVHVGCENGIKNSGRRI